MKTILLVDDDELIREMFGDALGRLGYRTITGSSGSEGLELARKHLPDLILSDINMPGIDGCSLLQSLRADSELAANQIVLMTGKSTEFPPVPHTAEIANGQRAAGRMKPQAMSESHAVELLLFEDHPQDCDAVRDHGLDWPALNQPPQVNE